MTATLGNITATPALSSQIAATTTNAPPSKKVIIIWQKSTISSACKKALATIEGGVHVWDPLVDGQKLDAEVFVKASYDCLILWSGDTAIKTAAADVHTWLSKNRAYIKTNAITTYVIPSKLFSLAGIHSVYEDFAIAIKALPKWSEDLGSLLIKFEAQFPTGEVSVVMGLINKAIHFFSKNGTAS